MRLLLLLIGLIPSWLYAEELARTTIDFPKPVTVVIESKSTKKLLNKMLVLDLKFESIDQQKCDVELLAFDARMPEHRHGMLVKPTVTKRSTNLYMVQGVKFHMRGHWEMELKVKALSVEKDIKIPLRLR